MGNFGSGGFSAVDFANIMDAAERNDARTVRYLFNKHAQNLGQEVESSVFSIAIAALKNNSTPIIQTLMDVPHVKKMLVGVHPQTRDSLVSITANDGDSEHHQEIVQFLLRQKTTVDTINTSGALHAAAREDHYNVMNILLKANADPAAKFEEMSPIFLSLDRNAEHTFALLEEAGQRVTLRELTRAARHCNLDLFKRGLEHVGGWENLGDNDKQSMLVYAAHNWDSEVPIYVLEEGCGSNGNAFDVVQSETALKAACGVGHPATVVRLLECDAWPNLDVDGGHEGMDSENFAIAADEGSEGGGAEKMKALLDRGCNPNGGSIKAARASALRHDNPDVAQLLVEKYPMDTMEFIEALETETHPCPAPVRTFSENCQPMAYNELLEVMQGIVKRMCGWLPLQELYKRDLEDVISILVQRPRKVNYNQRYNVSHEWSAHDIVDIVKPILNVRFQERMALKIAEQTKYNLRKQNFNDDIKGLLRALHGGPHYVVEEQDEVFDPNQHEGIDREIERADDDEGQEEGEGEGEEEGEEEGEDEGEDDNNEEDEDEEEDDNEGDVNMNNNGEDEDDDNDGNMDFRENQNPINNEDDDEDDDED